MHVLFDFEACSCILLFIFMHDELKNIRINRTWIIRSYEMCDPPALPLRRIALCIIKKGLLNWVGAREAINRTSVGSCTPPARPPIPEWLANRADQWEQLKRSNSDMKTRMGSSMPPQRPRRVSCSTKTVANGGGRRRSSLLVREQRLSSPPMINPNPNLNPNPSRTLGRSTLNRELRRRSRRLLVLARSTAIEGSRRSSVANTAWRCRRREFSASFHREKRERGSSCTNVRAAGDNWRRTRRSSEHIAGISSSWSIRANLDRRNIDDRILMII